MSLLEKAYETYKNLEHIVGVTEEGKRPLPPISHIIANAQIEVTIDIDGNFHEATITDNETKKTIIPVTESSAGRSSGIAPHALSDNLTYITNINIERHRAFLEQLEKWVNSEHSHKKAQAIFNYIKSDCLLKDLQTKNILKLDENGKFVKEKILATEYEKCIVRWVVIGNNGVDKDACYEDKSLFDSYINYYNSILKENGTALCVISGKVQPITINHPKGIVAIAYGAKLLISSDTNKGFVSYEVSQKAHNTLRYLISNYGISIGDMSFVWWNTKNKDLPKFDRFDDEFDNETEDFSITDYKKIIRDTFTGYKNKFEAKDNIVIATFEAATTGRLSVTYYNELKANDYFDRLDKWYSSIAFVQENKYAPKFRQIITYAYGTDTGKYIEIHNKKILSEHTKVLLNCMINGQAIPLNIVRALVVNASSPLKYSSSNYNRVLYTACAVLRKYKNDKYKREEYKMALDEKNTNRSYLFGRLLAICDKVESSTYKFGEERETNATRIQTTFCNRPMTSFKILENQLIPYYGKLKGGLPSYFKNMITEILQNIDPNDMKINKPLEDVYLLGYYHQRAKLNQKKSIKLQEENTND